MKSVASVIFRSTMLILFGMALGIYISQDKVGSQLIGFPVAGNDKMSKVLQLVQNNYVDSVDVDSIEGATVNELLQKLDPHSIYLQPKQATAVSEKLEGGFTGLGLEYTLLRDTFVITQVYPGSPAAKAGLEGGMKVTYLNGNKFSGTALTEDGVKALLRPADKKAAITLTALMPTAVNEKKQFVIKPGPVKVSSIDGAYMAADGVGYVKISKFASTTDADFQAAIARLKAEGMKQLLLDLRGNGGGYLNTATALADEFLTEGKLIVYTQGLHEARTDYKATNTGVFEKGKMAVLIDEHSASASEILSGALQDLDRAVIVGRRSFGKGLVQQQFPFEDGSAVNLTVARYYTPSGRSIQKSYSQGVESYRNELAERMRKGELFSAETNMKDSIFSKNSPYHTSSGKKVFSGGGIMPDIFVPADTSENTYLIAQLSDGELFTAYTLDRMLPILKQYETSKIFVKNYEVDDQQLADFVAYISPQLKDIDSAELRASSATIKMLIKAYAARFKWGDTAYFESINENDATVTAAINAVK